MHLEGIIVFTLSYKSKNEKRTIQKKNTYKKMLVKKMNCQDY